MDLSHHKSFFFYLDLYKLDNCDYMKNLPLCTTCVYVYTAKEREEKGSEVILIDRACAYVMSGEYPADANKNGRRSIRRKAALRMERFFIFEQMVLK